MSKPFVLNIDLNVLNHLGLNLYSNVPAVLAELIANSWDADATRVDITVDQKTANKQIFIKDNGCGMNELELQEKFLNVGYQRRVNEAGDLTEKEHRQVMGRKGIGKLSAFSIAEIVQVVTRKDNNDLLSIKLEVDKIREAINNKEKYYPAVVEPPTEIQFDGTGTVLILSDLKKRVNVSLDIYLSQRIARRFSIFSDKFRVFINDREVTLEDRGYFKILEFALYYGDFVSSKFTHDQEHVVKRENLIQISNKKFMVNGWIGLVENSGDLQSGTNNINKISILARGKVALEDILESYREGGLYTKYVIGELEADFLDLTGKEDIATSSRQDFIQSDERYILLRKFVKTELDHLRQRRVKLKDAKGEQKALEIPSVKDWYETLNGDRRNAAKKLFGKINQIAVDNIHRKTLYKHGILAFEHLHHKEKLNQLDQLDIENLDTVVTLFSELDDIEASWYYQITEGRLDVIRKLAQHVNDDVLERIIQDHVYTHLWLLDPSWDRATETPTLEQTVTTAFKAVSKSLSDEERRGRIDIRYKKTLGQHVIIELKRASVITTTHQLMGQVEKYKRALKKQLKEANESDSIEIICLVGRELQDWYDSEARDESERSLAAKHIRVVTYQQMIKDAELQYQQYLEKDKDRGRIQKILDEIQEYEYPENC